jgi:hypothetical protein
MMTNLTRLAALFTLAAAVGGCAGLAPGRDYNDLTLSERAKLAACATSSSLPPNTIQRSDPAGTMLDKLLSIPGKISDNARVAAEACAKGMGVAPNTIPGMGR